MYLKKSRIFSLAHIGLLLRFSTAKNPRGQPQVLANAFNMFLGFLKPLLLNLLVTDCNQSVLSCLQLKSLALAHLYCIF